MCLQEAAVKNYQRLASEINEDFATGLEKSLTVPSGAREKHEQDFRV